MANRLYNRQVSPKGYEKGGSVGKGKKSEKDYKIGFKLQGDYKGKSVPGKAKEFFKTAAKQTAGTIKKSAKAIGEKVRTKKMGGGMMKRPMMKAGGKTLKPVDKEKNPGLAKLPTKVRNKMGFMKKGGKV